MPDDLELAFRMVDAADAVTETAWVSGGMTASLKSDGSPVTEADVAAERAMLAVVLIPSMAVGQTAGRDVIDALLKRSETGPRVAQQPAPKTGPAAAPPVTTEVEAPKDPREGDPAYEQAQRLMDWFCKRVGVRSLSDEQYTAIVRGLSREIAVYRGVRAEGFDSHMTSRTSDALGIDMVITDAKTGKYVNIDCKAPSAYRHRVYDLLREGRLTEEEVTAAEMLGYIGEMNGHGSERTEVIVWRIEKERYGEIAAFSFPDTAALGQTIRAILNTYGVK